MHDNPGTAANYEDFYAADSAGKRLREVGVLEDAPLSTTPKSEKRSSIAVDAQLRDVIGDAERWGEGSNVDRLERIIARAELADRLERQLARECEKRQALELKLSQLEKPVEGKAAPVEPAAVVDKPSGFDWRSVSNAELNGDRRHDAYAEKLRRSVEAVQEYNAGREFDEQFAITGSLLRQLTGVKPGKVKQWIDENKSALDSYNADYSARQNVGKIDSKNSDIAKASIKWSEAAYGAYEW